MYVEAAKRMLCSITTNHSVLIAVYLSRSFSIYLRISLCMKYLGHNLT